mgnify:CR=1 FL=1
MQVDPRHATHGRVTSHHTPQGLLLSATPHPPPTPRGPCHRATVGLGEGRESARMGNPSELLASAGVIGIRPEAPGQGSKQGGRHGKPSITLHCPSHRTPPSGHRGTQETVQLSRSERPGPEWIPTAKIHPCQPYMIPTTTPFIPDGPFVHTHYVLIRVTGGSMACGGVAFTQPPFRLRRNEDV